MDKINDLVVKLVRLHDEIDDLSGLLEDKKKEYNELNRIVTDQCEFDKIRQIKVVVDGKPKSVHLRSQYWAKKHENVTGEDVYNVLLDVAPELAQRTFNTNSLSAWLREQNENNEGYELPEPLANLVDFKKVTQAVVTGK